MKSHVWLIPVAVLCIAITSTASRAGQPTAAQQTANKIHDEQIGQAVMETVTVIHYVQHWQVYAGVMAIATFRAALDGWRVHMSVSSPLDASRQVPPAAPVGETEAAMTDAGTGGR